MLKKVIFICIAVATGIILCCLSQINYELSLKEDNTRAIEIVDYVG